MKVILKKDVKGQGKVGDVIDVKDGYGQNFLIRNGYAVLYTQRSKEILDISNKNKAQKEAMEVERCNEIKKRLEKDVLVFKVKAGKEDQVFGSVSTKQIAHKLEEKGYKVDKKKIVLEEPISSLGFHEVKIILHKNVEAVVRVELVK